MKTLLSLLCLFIAIPMVLSQGNVGIGNSAPHAPLQFATSVADRKIVLYEQENDTHQFYGFGVNPSILRYQVPGLTSNHVFYAGTSTPSSVELLRITGSGILKFPVADANRKIVLSEVGNNDHQVYGFGVNESALHYQVPPSANHIFYAGANSSSSNELMRIQANGNVGIDASNPHERLEVGGDGRAFFGDGQVSGRKGLLIDGLEGTDASRLEAYDYSIPGGRNLVINTLGGGNVGIGTGSPTRKLDVEGSVHISDSLFFDGNGIIVSPGWLYPDLPHGHNGQSLYARVSYYKDREGRVHLRGRYDSDELENPVFNLIPGYRPEYYESFIIFLFDTSTSTSTFGTLTVHPDGTVYVSPIIYGVYHFDGISFRAAN